MFCYVNTVTANFALLKAAFKIGPFVFRRVKKDAIIFYTQNQCFIFMGDRNFYPVLVIVLITVRNNIGEQFIQGKLASEDVFFR